MVKIEIDENPIKSEVPFPKLMRGKNTNAIYLATKKWYDFHEWRVEVVVIVESKESNKMGSRTNYPIHMLTDFDGSITIRNEE